MWRFNSVLYAPCLFIVHLLLFAHSLQFPRIYSSSLLVVSDFLDQAKWDGPFKVRHNSHFLTTISYADVPKFELILLFFSFLNGRKREHLSDDEREIFFLNVSKRVELVGIKNSRRRSSSCRFTCYLQPIQPLLCSRIASTALHHRLNKNRASAVCARAGWSY